MSCRWSYQIPHCDDACLDCEVLSLGGEGLGEPYFTDERCIYHQQLHPFDICDVRLKSSVGGGGYYCYTHNKWGKDWVTRDIEFDVVQGITV